MIQILLYARINKTLSPLSILQNKLKHLESGDLTSLQIESEYDEIKQISKSYNSSISKIEYILEMREMFNKIFMHEMKMPIAKGMFYLKQTPSQKTHENIKRLFDRLNSELNEFSILESLIVYKERLDIKEYKLKELVNIAIDKVTTDNQDNISINIEDNSIMLGDKELWVLCFKNLLDNALKYASDKCVEIYSNSGGVVFRNRGTELPIDISKNNKKWKIDKDKRHKSSTGYGFGLFIIKNSIELNGYILEYGFDDGVLEFKILRANS
jgi:two-component system OmpR family sensor kinase